ncbi:hypothetical protein [Brachybacterium sp. YJGR34]|uniref:hypothetical protein n=1 Tax=Brachybacterium sp. YJGR34 TaxID=2059911 RepID=UPI000E0B8E90|nr:hypothetical protein [Brachybacterium sp. YJGR34]
MLEDLADAASSLEEVGSREIDGASTDGYELTSEERTETWWIDGDGRLRAFEFVYADGSTGGGTLFGYGEESRVDAP